MLSHYTRQVSHQKALLLTLTAKKRAEVSPGIGKRTDMFFIGDHGFGTLSPEIGLKLTEIHEEMEKKIARVTLEADEDAHKFVEEFLRKAQASQSAHNEQQPDEGDGLGVI